MFTPPSYSLPFTVVLLTNTHPVAGPKRLFQSQSVSSTNSSLRIAPSVCFFNGCLWSSHYKGILLRVYAVFSFPFSFLFQSSCYSSHQNIQLKTNSVNAGPDQLTLPLKKRGFGVQTAGYRMRCQYPRLWFTPVVSQRPLLVKTVVSLPEGF